MEMRLYFESALSNENYWNSFADKSPQYECCDLEINTIIDSELAPLYENVFAFVKKKSVLAVIFSKNIIYVSASDFYGDFVS